ncbi:MAG TPA: acyl-CoA carboxylase subunit beta [Jatrophihabitans sp.]|jgi:acetyl-CoA carboxylase carboxyltransferase component|uniref:acyl-CoA carboxylase subunit beta n=1 Tax=Jatrophihabitans sp. TaxID=1932789 RepID=UPI002EE1B2C2
MTSPEDTPDMHFLVNELKGKRQLAEAGPNPQATIRQHEKGKKTARERIEALFDEGTFVEIDTLRRHQSHAFGLAQNRPYTDGVVTGWGKVYGRTVFTYAHDFRMFGGSLGEEHAKKIQKVMDLAFKARRPIVSLNDGAGARIQEGVSALAGYGGIFTRHVQASGVIPQISVMLGPCAGGAAYSPSLTDFVFMVDKTAQMFVTGPDVVRAVTGEEVSHDDLGGARIHAERSGVCHCRYDDEDECLADVRFLLSMLPDNNQGLAPDYATADDPDRRVPELLDIVPTSPRMSYDVRDVITVLVDDGEDFELQADWAPSIVCTLARLGGRLVGIVANQPAVNAGVLDIESSEKAARFVQMCDSFNIPLVTLVDVPGFLPGVDQEHNGIIRHGAKLLFAYCNATVPRISLILRKAYGGAYIVMDSRSIGADLALAWPTNEVAVMGAEGAANVIFRHEIAASKDPEAHRKVKVRAYSEEFMNPYYAAERGLVDEVIDPSDTRRILIDAVEMLRDKSSRSLERKHGNPPL